MIFPIKNLLLYFLIYSFIVGCSTSIEDISSNVGVIGDSAMVASAHPLASQVGVDIMRKGGNAFDAAVAVQFALAVVYPRAGNIGGGGFAVIRESNGNIASLDFREKAPSLASKDMYLDINGEVIQGKSTVGRLACGVPGTVDGMYRLHEKYGSMSMSELIQPSIFLADQGFILTADEAQNLNRFQEDFKANNSWAIPTIKETAWQEGDSIYYKELAVTLSLIRDMGRAGFYEGIIADQIVKDLRRGGGIMTMEDLANYESKWREPVVGQYRNHKIISMPPPSSGGVALIQLLRGSEKYSFDNWGHNTPKTMHAMIELERRVYADRATYLGDPDYYEVPQEMLLSDEYLEERFSDIALNKKTDSKAIKEGIEGAIESVETTHFSIVDPFGNAIAITTTLNNYFGNKVMVKGAGFFLNDEMDDFSLKPGVPNQFGLIGAEANAIAPNKRMLSSMTPTIVEKDGRLLMLTGTPGGATIITSVYQTILNVIDHGMTMQESVNAKRFHHQWLPDKVLFEEGGFDPKVISELTELGHNLELIDGLGRMDCILVMEDGKLEGASDITRGNNTSLGF
ncbi:MAG: gamma-glutamyltransferase [Bacteroidetes bacterium]|nr:gamma-glutamyltransferase [Bacteroidota bacterium]MDA1121046.1 gamma-glutamyltransferase [Bacteroidota bacterium]